MSRLKIVLACILVFGAAVYFILNSFENKIPDYTAVQGTEATVGKQENTLATESDTGVDGTIAETQAAVQTPEPLNRVEIKIINNSPEYDLKLTLTEDSEKKTFLELEYYFDGTGMQKTLDNTLIPELEGIFEKKVMNTSESGNYEIEKAYFNPKLAKVYFIVSGNGTNGFVQSDMYVISLADAAVKKVFSKRGKFSEMYLSKDNKYLAYSYNDPKESSVLQEASLLDVINCDSDELVVENSRVKDVKIGSNLPPEAVYDYTFVSWYSQNTARLKQKPVLDEKAGETEVIYDISRNLMLDKAGSVIKAEKEANAGESEKLPSESEALKVLKDFYGFLGSETDYQKAMELLDDSFTIKLAIFTQFGFTALTKSDINAEDASMFSDMLKAASFDSIVKEEEKNGAVNIYYYQNMELSADNLVRQPMHVKLAKLGNAWKIITIEDADES